VHADVLHRVARGLAELGLPVVGVMRSPLLGADGNVEFLVHCRKGAIPVPDAALDAAVGSPGGARSETNP